MVCSTPSPSCLLVGSDSPNLEKEIVIGPSGLGRPHARGEGGTEINRYTECDQILRLARD